MDDPVALFLPRLANVRQFGKGWRADCPVGHKSRGALSLAQSDNGNLLLHCFAGCSTSDVLAALGLSLADLYLQRIRQETPEQRRELRHAARQTGWGAALGVLAFESTIIQIAAESILLGRALSANDVQRVHVASSRIHDCREVLR